MLFRSIKQGYIDCSNNDAQFSGPSCSGNQDDQGRPCQLNMSQTGCLDETGDCQYEGPVNEVSPPENGQILPNGCEKGYYVENTGNIRGCIPCEPISDAAPGSQVICTNPNNSQLDVSTGSRCRDGYKLNRGQRGTQKENDTCELITCDSMTQNIIIFLTHILNQPALSNYNNYF